MSKQHNTPELPSGGVDAGRSRRRFVVELAVLGLAAPMITTLTPSVARAEGSWSCGGQPGAQGSWSCATRPGWGGPGGERRLEARSSYAIDDERRQSFVFPGTHEWRLRREQEAELRRQMRGELGKFGSSEEWR